jgi:hypothetical protein
MSSKSSWLSNNVDMEAHPFEKFMNPARPAKRQRLGATEWQMTGVFVDDFCLGAVENATGSLLRRISRAALHSIHATFPAPEVSGHTGGKDSISLKKLEKGDARWATSKELLGFLVDGERRTVQLPQTKADGITKELRRILRKRTVAIKVFQKIVGKLRHAAIVSNTFFSNSGKLNQNLYVTFSCGYTYICIRRVKVYFIHTHAAAQLIVVSYD